MAVGRSRDEATAQGDVQRARTLHRAAARDQVEVGLFGTGVAAGALGDVQRDR
jgi:hypothetical protein